MIHVKEVKKENYPVLFNFMQKYLYEMSSYYDNEMNAEGNYEYPYLPYYFEEKHRKAFFICDDDIVIGFTLINDHSFTGEPIKNCIAEFTIFPAYRHKGNGMKTMDLLMQSLPGSWQLKYSLKNEAGTAFWKKVREKYEGTETWLGEDEVALTIR